MAVTQSNMIPLGSEASNFTLLDAVSGNRMNLYYLSSNIATVIMFICNHCSYVKYIQEHLVKFTRDYTDKKISFIAINSNNVNEYPEDSLDKMKEVSENFNFCFPYLFDETQSVAKAYKASCTPDFFVYDLDLKLVYRGQYDSSRPQNEIPVSGHDLGKALDLILENKTLNFEQIPSTGCNIK